jgi:hypothetical protein
MEDQASLPPTFVLMIGAVLFVGVGCAFGIEPAPTAPPESTKPEATAPLKQPYTKSDPDTGTGYTSSEEFSKYALKLREAALTQIEPKVVAPIAASANSRPFSWKVDIVTTVFWIGSKKHPKGPAASAWDSNWQESYGGFDDPTPEARREFHPVKFIPRQNPFYCALPYNDVFHGTTKSEAPKIIPWFKPAFVREGQSVCQNHWVAIRNRRVGKTAYAQWSDCGPFGSDHAAYVFGDERPQPNANGGAGLNVSPAVRDFLDLATTDVTDWRFVNVGEIPAGPWCRFGDNNEFVQAAQRAHAIVPDTPAKNPTASDELKVTSKPEH